MVVKAAMGALGMTMDEIGDWIREAPEDEVLRRLLNKEVVQASVGGSTNLGTTRPTT